MTKDEEIKKSIESGKSIENIRKDEIKKDDVKTNIIPKIPKTPKKEKAKINIENLPKEFNLNDGEIILEITPDMAEALCMGILDTMAFLMPDKLKPPEKRHGEIMKQPSYLVIQRWMPKVNFLKYLPEIILATSFVSVIKDMKKTENKKDVKA